VAEVYLVRHGEARTDGDDAQRTLTERGEREVEAIATWAAARGVRVDEIRHSGKTRAAQTAAILSRHLGSPAVAASGLAPNDDPRAFAIGSGSVMIVSHLPFLGRLASHLLIGDPDREIIVFQAAGMARLIQAENGWRVAWLFSGGDIQ
jgi:phosphohistidine phosphatase